MVQWSVGSIFFIRYLPGAQVGQEVMQSSQDVRAEHPFPSKPFVGFVRAVGALLEATPGAREFSGLVAIGARYGMAE